MTAASQRGVDLGLNDDEIAFYDALAANNSAVEAMGNSESIREQETNEKSLQRS